MAGCVLWGSEAEGRNARVIRTETRKLIRRYPGPNGHYPNEFYDLERDAGEQENRMDDAAYRAEIETLSQRLDAHFATYEIEGRSGREIDRVPKCNPGHAPWDKPTQ